MHNLTFLLHQEVLEAVRNLPFSENPGQKRSLVSFLLGWLEWHIFVFTKKYFTKEHKRPISPKKAKKFIFEKGLGLRPVQEADPRYRRSRPICGRHQLRQELLWRAGLLHSPGSSGAGRLQEVCRFVFAVSNAGFRLLDAVGRRRTVQSSLQRLLDQGTNKMIEHCST